MADPVSIGLMVGSTALSAYGQYSQGRAARDGSRFEAAQMDDQAEQAVIRGELEAEETRRIRDVALSDARARMASDGGLDPQQVAQLGELSGAYERNALQNIYQASVDAATLRRGGQARRFEGRTAQRAGTTGALTTALTGGQRIYDSW